MKAIVGLGNPGSRYQTTRHNIGFLVVERLAQAQGAAFKSSRCCQGLEAIVEIDGRTVRLLEPMTFMNLSGQAVKSFLRYYGVAQSDLLVVYDDFHLAFGQLRVRRQGSHGGHNGIGSIIESLGSQEFPRVRLGIGEVKRGKSAEDFVLSNFSSAEIKELDFFLQEAGDCCRAWVAEEIEQVMSHFNKRKGDG